MSHASLRTDIRFLVIGTEKAGTTSLFEYLRRHPEVHLPAGKEVAFFIDQNYGRGWSWYVRHVLHDAPAGRIAGEASVAYMSGSPLADSSYLTTPTFTDADERQPVNTLSSDCAYEEVIPRRIAAHLPDIRLLCILRDPVARAYSQYRMEVLEGVESRPFDDVVNELLTPDALAIARAAPKRTNSYVIKGEYARILGGFLRVFPRDRLLVMFSEELSLQTETTLKTVLDFIGARDDYVPDNLRVRYREGTVRRRVQGLNLYSFQAKISKTKWARELWHALPKVLRDRIDVMYRVASFRVVMWNAHRGDTDDHISDFAERKLQSHFRPDSQELGELLCAEIPWLKTWDQAVL
jgi:Sulfotransferase domain